ncbi:MAG: IS200/IS605 family transposase [Chloroflexota bacterium]|nr:IS200/IS605 family transposase [Chloroflexota bacterium]
MPYWRLFYHLIWATKDWAPLIDPAVEDAIERSFRAICEELGVRLFATGVVPDEVHLVVSIPPRLALADVVGRLKGASSFAVKGADHRSDGARFAWQGEYGALSFGEKSLPGVVAYVKNQTARHATNDLWPTLERFADQTAQPPSGGFVGSARGFEPRAAGARRSASDGNAPKTGGRP